MPPNPRALAAIVPFQFKPGTSGNPGGKPGRRRLAEWQEFAAGVPFDVIDPATNKPYADPETGETLSRDAMVMQATFRCAVDIRRKDCTRAQLNWNAYVRGTPRPSAPPAVEPGTETVSVGPRVVLYMPNNGRGPKAEDVKPPPAEATAGPVPEFANGSRPRD